MIDEIFKPLPCNEAADEVEAQLGLLSHGRLVREFVNALRSCKNPCCPGNPRIVIVDEACARAEADAILALRN